jgi:hypothetical protein
MSASRILAAIFGAIVALVALGCIFGGAGLITAAALRSQEGVVWTDPIGLGSTRYAVTAPDVHIRDYPGDWLSRGLIEVRFEVTPTNSKAIFAGVGPTADVNRYLAGVGRDTIADFGSWRATIETKGVEGAAPAARPADQRFWVASTEGNGTRSLVWVVGAGDWTVAMLNADGSEGIATRVRLGAYVPFLAPLGGGMLVIGLILAVLAIILLVWATTGSRGSSAAAPAYAPRSTAMAPLYPVTIEGRIDPNLSRWMWLIKWILAIPHFIVLAFLWFAFCILTVVAFFAILFTGRYPRGIFEFNVGVLRWSWRVAFYAFNPAATDRYPPFTLEPTDYPARFDVAYPGELSRGLVLVKWWLLAIPHYIIVALFTNGLIWWAQTPAGDSPVLRTGGGVIGILVFVSLIALLFTGRYLTGLFDLIMGLNRWVFRVIAYAALMRDEYPPFRIDLGGEEPHTTAGAAPTRPIGRDQVRPAV